MKGADKPEATNIRRKYVNLAGTMFDFRETFAVNCERLAAAAMKSQGFGIVVHDNLTANILMATRISFPRDCPAAHSAFAIKMFATRSSWTTIPKPWDFIAAAARRS